MADAKPVILYDSPEAAEVRTVTGWVSRDGRFWGDNEHMARWDGCTHTRCDRCKEPVDKGYVLCKPCCIALEHEKFMAMPVEAWDGSAWLYSNTLDRYFATPDEAADYAHPNGIDSIDLVICDPNHMHELDSEEWCDELSDDGELPDAVQVALDGLNEAIRKAGPVSWSPGETRLDVAAWLKAQENSGFDLEKVGE